MTARTVAACAHCGVILDGHDSTDGEDVPVLPRGAVMMCLYCGRPSLFDDQGPRVPTAREMEELYEQADVLNFTRVWMQMALADKLPDPVARGGRKMPRMTSPGAYIDDDGALHMDLPQMCIWQGVKPTAANQEMLARQIQKLAADSAIEVHPDSGSWS